MQFKGQFRQIPNFARYLPEAALNYNLHHAHTYVCDYTFLQHLSLYRFVKSNTRHCYHYLNYSELSASLSFSLLLSLSPSLPLSLFPSFSRFLLTKR